MKTSFIILSTLFFLSADAQRIKCPTGPIDTIQCTVKIGLQEWNGVGPKPAPREVQAWAIVQKDSCRRLERHDPNDNSIWKEYDVFGMYSDRACKNKLPRGDRAYKQQP